MSSLQRRPRCQVDWLRVDTTQNAVSGQNQSATVGKIRLPVSSSDPQKNAKMCRNIVLRQLPRENPVWEDPKSKKRVLLPSKMPLHSFAWCRPDRDLAVVLSPRLASQILLLHPRVHPHLLVTWFGYSSDIAFLVAAVCCLVIACRICSGRRCIRRSLLLVAQRSFESLLLDPLG